MNVNISLVKNAGKYNKKILIYSETQTKDAQGFPVVTETEVLTTWANVKTTRGMTIIVNNSDFEKAYTNFTIRFPAVTITREMFIRFGGKDYMIEYVNDINEDHVELELQAREVTH